MATNSIVGYCPMGCGQTLLRTALAQIACSSPTCPRPYAVAELLADAETEHVIELRDDDFTVLHPMRERLDDALMTCPVHMQMSALDGPPKPVGRYRVRVHGDGSMAWLPAVPDGR